MPLTPADVRDVAFKKTPVGRRGYDEEHVDAFLDEVVVDLARLIEENNQLRAQAEHAGPDGAAAATAMAAEIDDLRTRLDQARRDKTALEQAARATQAELDRVRGGGDRTMGGDGEQQSSGVLTTVAQRTADDHLAEARREANRVLSDARREAEQLTVQARAKADLLERDAQRRHRDALAALDAKRSATQRQIEELIGFQREYRTELKQHMEGQLRDLDGRGPHP